MSSPLKPTLSKSEDDTSSSTGREEEKTIPFLKRLRDMLEENGGVISFAPGCRKPDQVVLGRIVVHDRIQMEAKVLPKYFSHSSFASLRRQLNYFNFVRMGKGRQRESTYVNDDVVEISDILQLKRRSGGSATTTCNDESGVLQLRVEPSVDSSPSAPPPVEIVDAPVPHTSTTTVFDMGGGDTSKREVVQAGQEGVIMVTGEGEKHPTIYACRKTKNPEPLSKQQRSKRRRLVKKATQPKVVSPRSQSPDHTFVSEDDSTAGKSIVLDLTLPPSQHDDDVLAGCNALLDLATLGWE